MGPPRFVDSLRFKLMIASLTLLAIPWVGYRYLQETEASLRQAQEELLLNRAEVVAGLLATALSANQIPLLKGDRVSNPSLYVHPLSQPVVVDGYPEEWQDLLTQTRRYRASETTPEAVSFDLLAGYQDGDLYLLIRVLDRRLTYPAANAALTQGDHLILALPGETGNSRQYLIGTSAPGWVSVERAQVGTKVDAIRGEWQESPGGYTVELRIPLAMTQYRLSLAAVDLAGPGGKIQGIASTSGWQRGSQLARLVMPDLPSDTLLQGLDSRRHRYTILNQQRQVVGRHGSLTSASDDPNSFTQRLLTLLLYAPGKETNVTREHAGRMDGPEIRHALNGKGGVYRYRFAGARANTLSAAYPLRENGEVAGVILVEQTTRNILLLQQQALERLIGVSLTLFLITGGTLFLLATWLTRRISRLSRKFSQAVSHDGRVVATISGSVEVDELGTLDRSFASVLQRLQSYNHYLEQMASRLAHEFRTPLAMVQSSLENLQAEETAGHHSRYTERALEGTRRLNLILNRMREATHLEQTLQSAELSPIDITELCRALCEGYRISHPQIALECEIPASTIEVKAAPELISQALDKLVGNAIDFHLEGSPIHITVATQGDQSIHIRVDNQGPALPPGMEEAIFQSMVSVREQRGDLPHLGLGLYLVKLILEFHQGRAFAENLPGGVRFCMELPIVAI
ncbi:MAG: ATP-binding protein [Candidatus Thiodiazotropha sp.]